MTNHAAVAEAMPESLYYAVSPNRVLPRSSGNAPGSTRGDGVAGCQD